MSTTTLVKTIPNLDNSYCSFLTVDRGQKENLPSFVQRIRKEKGLSTGDVEKKSGFTITDGYVSRIENNHIKNVSPEKLKALAKGLDVPEEEIFAIARGVKADGKAIADERFEILSLKFKTYKGEKKTRAQTLIDMIEREFERMDDE